MEKVESILGKQSSFKVQKSEEEAKEDLEERITFLFEKQMAY